MNKLTRAFVMTGVAAAAGLAISAAPATASPAGPSAAEVKPKHTATQQQDVKRRDRIVGFYRSPRTCHRIGKAGIWHDRWERYTCFRVYRGFHAGQWALKVSYGWGFDHNDRDRDWNDGPDNHHWNNGPQDQGPRGPWKKN